MSITRSLYQTENLSEIHSLLSEARALRFPIRLSIDDNLGKSGRCRGESCKGHPMMMPVSIFHHLQAAADESIRARQTPDHRSLHLASESFSSPFNLTHYYSDTPSSVTSGIER